MVVFILGLIADYATPLVVDYDYDTTYDWLTSPPGSQMEDLIEKRLEHAVETQLDAKGYSRSAESHDFLIALRGSRRRKPRDQLR
jgi:Domain of unknown function (DUF4136)